MKEFRPEAVALCVYNRPKYTRAVFDAVRAARPRRLYIVADGPKDNATDQQNVQRVREIFERVSWPCEVSRNYSSFNMGCKNRMATGISWIFENEDSAIILEDDCLPREDFFWFCESLLAHYAEDERVMSITGTNVVGEWRSEQQSFHFSHYGSVWGWASWRRAWQHYDLSMKLWERESGKETVLNVLADPKQFAERKRRFDAVSTGTVDTWDAAWLFACLLNNGLTIVPAHNLVENIGFGLAATHTSGTAPPIPPPIAISLQSPLKPPVGVAPDRHYDLAVYERLFKIPSLVKKILNKFHRLLLPQ